MSVRRRKERDPETGAQYEVWVVDIVFQHPDGRRTRVKKKSPVQTRRGAEDYERQLRNALLDGSYGRKEATVPTVAEFAKDFLEVYAKANNKPSEVATKDSSLRLHLVPALGRHRLDGINQEVLERYKSKKLAAGLAPKTINNHLAVLSRMLTLAVEWGRIEHAPAMKWLKVPEQKFDFLDFEEAERVVAAADDAWRPMVIAALKTGLRLGELLALRWQDVDLVAKRLVVRQAVARGVVGTPKSGKPREVPLSDAVLAALKRHRHLRGELVFCSEDGSMLTKEESKWPLWRACKRAGLRRIGWHTARHTFASHLVMRGAPLKAVQELLGHADIKMTMRYSHLSPDARRDVVKLLDYGPIADRRPGEERKSSIDE